MRPSFVVMICVFAACECDVDPQEQVDQTSLQIATGIYSVNSTKAGLDLKVFRRGKVEPEYWGKTPWQHPVVEGGYYAEVERYKGDPDPFKTEEVQVFAGECKSQKVCFAGEACNVDPCPVPGGGAP